MSELLARGDHRELTTRERVLERRVLHRGAEFGLGCDAVGRVGLDERGVAEWVKLLVPLGALGRRGELPGRKNSA